MSDDDLIWNDKLVLKDEQTGVEVTVDAGIFCVLDNKEHANKTAREYAEQALKDEIRYKKMAEKNKS